MEKNKNIIISVIIVVTLIIIGVLFVYTAKESNSEYIYHIDYFDDFIPGKNYDIYVYKDYSIKVVSQAGCSTLECLEGTYTPPVEEETIYLTEENKKFVESFMKEFMGENTKKETSASELNDYEETTIMAIATNNKEAFSYLADIHNNRNYTHMMSYYGMHDYRIYNYDGLIKVVEHDILCDEEVCEELNSYVIDFTYDSQKQINNFIKKIFQNQSTTNIDLNELTLTRSEEDLITALITNDETYMTYSIIMQDVSCNCMPNSVYFYEDGTYIIRGINYEIVDRGNYETDVNTFVNSLTDKMSDDEHWLNYKVYLKDGKEYYVMHSNEHVKAFLKDLQIKWIN